MIVRHWTVIIGSSLLAALLGCKQRSAIPPQKPPSTASPPSAPAAPIRAARSAADARCGECHQQIAEDYARHPMGRSLAKAQSAVRIESFGTDAHSTFDVGGYRYSVRLDGDRMLHREQRLGEDGEPVLTEERTVAFAVGSGQRGRSYLIQDGNRLLMSPLTFYPPHGKWDLSPGYERNNSHFHRPITGVCLHCHAGETHGDVDSLNRYNDPIFAQESIGCHRCHGPGDAHVRKHSDLPRETVPTESKGDDSIVNPARLATDRALDVCAQCHLSGDARVVAPGRQMDDFVPGERLRDSTAIYVERRDRSTQFVGHVEQMKESRCFVASDGRLRCTSCHDPHRSPDEAGKAAFFRARCLQCHTEATCSAPGDERAATTPADNCASCHMPVLGTEIRHAAVSDHRVPRRPLAAEDSPADKPLGISRLIPFDRTALDDPNYPLHRNAGLALLMAIDLHDREPRREDLAAAARSLEEAVQATPDDFVAREGLGAAYLRLNEPAAALAHFQVVLREHPRREFSISGAARGAFAVGRYREAAEYWEAAVEMNPSLPLYATELARTCAKSKNWRKGADFCAKAISRFPDNFVLRQLSIECHLGLGDRSTAESEFKELLRLNPPRSAEVRRWYEQHPLRSRN